jgi:hypothetical protein
VFADDLTTIPSGAARTARALGLNVLAPELPKRLGRIVLLDMRRDVAWPDCARALSSALGSERNAVAGLRKFHSNFLELETVYEVLLIVVSADEAELLTAAPTCKGSLNLIGRAAFLTV